MANNTVDLVARRIGEHLAERPPAHIDVILHGGEPLLAGPELIGHSIRAIRAEVDRATGHATTVRAMLQTNGSALTASMLELCRSLDLGIGVSLDGTRAAHDRHRRTAGGLSSYDRAAAALDRLNRPRYRPLFRGLLCTIDLRNDPLETYESLLQFSPPAIDFLLPHGNWSQLPPGREQGPEQIPYADWLIAVFDRWYDAAMPETEVRLFSSIMRLLAGGRSTVETLGGRPAEAVVIETDGELTHSDTLAASEVAAGLTGLSVGKHALAAVLAQPPAGAGLPTACRSCRLRAVCGGGLPAHRYRAGAGIDHRSVYCPDLFALISHTRRRLDRDLEGLRAGR
jgi:uncharacterized protein